MTTLLHRWQIRDAALISSRWHLVENAGSSGRAARATPVLLVLVVAGLLTSWAGCRRAEAPQRLERPVVATTFYPLSYIAQRIGGAHLEVVCPLPDEADPSTWMPDTTAIQVYQQADLILVNGAGFEHWLSKVSLPNSKVVETTRPLGERLLRFEQAITHSHGPSGQHSHEGIDGHTWLDPQNAIQQAGEIRQALLRLLPQAATELTANADSLSADLQGLDAALRKLTEALGDRPLLASHPAYNYLAKRYGWKLTSLSLDPDEPPGAETLAEVRNAVAKTPARVLLWERAPRAAVAEAYQKELGLQSVVFSPCETPTVGEDYLSAMQHNVTRLAEAIREFGVR